MVKFLKIIFFGIFRINFKALNSRTNAQRAFFGPTEEDKEEKDLIKILFFIL